MKRTTIVLNAVGFIGLRGFVLGTVLGGIYGTLAFPIVGTMYGALFGAIIGLPVGLVGGALLGIITALVFNPVENPGVFRMTIILLGGLIALVGAFLGFGGMFGMDGTLAERIAGVLSGDGFDYGFLPSIIAALSATYVSYRYVRYYLATDDAQSSPDTHRYETITG